MEENKTELKDVDIKLDKPLKDCTIEEIDAYLKRCISAIDSVSSSLLCNKYDLEDERFFANLIENFQVLKLLKDKHKLKSFKEFSTKLTQLKKLFNKVKLEKRNKSGKGSHLINEIIQKNNTNNGLEV